MKHQAIITELRSTTGLFASFILIALLGVSSIGVAQVDTWTQRADMPTARATLGTAVVNGQIYAIGGWTQIPMQVYFSTVEVYDPATDTWMQRADMPTARSGLSPVAVDGKIYAIGGFDGQPLSTVGVYDPATDTWETKTDMPTARGLYSIGVVNGKI